MKKKFLAILLAICIVSDTQAVALEDMTVQAAEYRIEVVGEDLQYGNYNYRISRDGTVQITKYRWDGMITELVIPSEIDGRKVTEIGDRAFRYGNGLTHITIPDTVTAIGEEAFSGCVSLTGITIPDTVSSIGKGAFFYC